MSSASCHLNLLDKVQKWAESLLGGNHSHASYQGQREYRNQDEFDKRTEQTTPLDSLDHLRKLAALTVPQGTNHTSVPSDKPERHWRRLILIKRTLMNHVSFLKIPRTLSSTHQRAFSCSAVARKRFDFWGRYYTNVYSANGSHRSQVAASTSRMMG